MIPGPAWARSIVLFLPCIAILIGLRILESAWAAILLFHAVIAICLFHRRSTDPFSRLLKGWNTSVGAVSMLACALCGPLLILLWPVITGAQGGMAQALGSFGLYGARLWLFAVYFATLHPVLEEVFWRGVMAPENRKVDLVDVAFGAYHVLVLVHFLKSPWVIIVFVILVLVSWLWRLMAERYGGLAVPALSHMTAGAGIMTSVFFLLGR